jgi:magnesium-transporting ATPase (P-type)
MVGGERLGYDEYALSRSMGLQAPPVRPNGLTGDKATDRLQNAAQYTSHRKEKELTAIILRIRAHSTFSSSSPQALSFFSGYAYSDPARSDGAAILAVVIINIAFSIFQEYRAERPSRPSLK